jgi:uncharacterized protein YbcI
MNSEQNIQSLLLQSLQSATSQDPQQVKQAEQNLSNWEKEENFYSTLLSFFANTNLDEGARYMAIITLKNGIDKHWRKNQKE